MSSRSVDKSGKDLKNIPIPLLKSLVAGDVIPVVGAGFSRNGDGVDGFMMPDWSSLGKAVAEEMPDYAYDGNPIEALSVYEDRYKRPALVEALRRIMRIDEVYPGEAHRLFVQCFRNVICTTNIDMLLEMAFVDARLRHVVVTSEDGLTTLSRRGVSLIKVHGDLNHPKKMVLTEDDYDLFASKNPLLCTFISNLFITKTMLLVGYSLDDADLRQLLKIVQDRLGKISRPVYCIQVEASKETVAKFERRGVTVINLKGARGQTYKDMIIDLFRRLKGYLDAEYQMRVSSSDEDSKEQLILSRQDNKLCFVAAPKNRIAYLRKMLNPVITKAGAVPLWPDNVQVEDGMDYRGAMYAALKRSRVKIFDVSESDGDIAALLQDALSDDKESTILISSSREDVTKNRLLSDRHVALYRLDGEGDLGDLGSNPNDAFLDALCGSVKMKTGISKSGILEGAKRLLNSGEYNSAVVSAWTELESSIRGEDSYLNQGTLTDSLNKLAEGDRGLRTGSINLRRLRNEVVHGIRDARKKDAQYAINVVERLLSKIGNKI